MAPKIRTEVHVRGKRNIASAILVYLGLVALLTAPSAFAQQQMVLQPPSFPTTTRPSLIGGLFYVSGGIKMVNIPEIRFIIRPHSVSEVRNEGVPAFGPNVAGIVNYPYQAGPPELPTRDPLDLADSGIWVYDDGLIDPRAGCNTDVGGQPVSSDFTFGDEFLGHFNVPIIVDDPLSPGTPIEAYGNQGYFRIADVPAQSSTAAPGQTGEQATTFAEMQSVSFTKTITGRFNPADSPCGLDFPTGTPGEPSLILDAESFSSQEVTFTKKLWMPYFEAGYQASNYFDIFGGVSWYSLRKAFARDYDAVARVGRRTFTDTFEFESTNDQSNAFGGFTTDLPNLVRDAAPEPDITDSYVMFPQGRRGVLPVRTFSTEIDPSIAPTAATETLSNEFDYWLLEFRTGARSWYPLYGMGRIGTVFGSVIAAIPYTVVHRSVIVADEDIPNPDGGENIANAGDILVDSAHKEDDMWTGVGIFGGVELEMMISRFFLKSHLGYDYYFGSNSYDGQRVETVLHPGGATAMFELGSRF